MGKRGISAIVATVLIILITVAAVTIIWAAIIPMITKGVEFQDPSLKFDIVSSTGYTFYDAASNSLHVQVRRGTDTVDVVGLEFVISMGGNTINREYGREVVPAPNQAKTLKIDLGAGSTKPVTIKVVPVINDGGSAKAGTPTSTVTEVRVGEGLPGEQFTPLKGGASVTCLTAAQCNDGKSCTTDTCVNDLCVYTPGVEVNNNGVDENCDGFAVLTTCYNITVGGVSYRLDNDFSTTELTCFNISADNVVLNGNSRAVTGPLTTALANYGVYGYGVRNNVTVQNLLVNNFTYSIYFPSSSVNSTFSGNTIRSSVPSMFLYGLYVTNGVNDKLENNIINLSSNSSTIYGLYLYSAGGGFLSSNNLVRGNEVWALTNGSMAYGIYLRNLQGSSINNVVQNNNVVASSTYSVSNSFVYPLYLSTQSTTTYPSSMNFTTVQGNTVSGFAAGALGSAYGIRVYMNGVNTSMSSNTMNGNTVCSISGSYLKAGYYCSGFIATPSRSGFTGTGNSFTGANITNCTLDSGWPAVGVNYNLC